MRDYNISKVKLLFNENKYKELIQIVNQIRNVGEYDKEDINILNYLFKNKDVNTYLYETMISVYEEFKNKFMNVESDKNEYELSQKKEQVLESYEDLSNLNKIFADKKITVTEYKLSKGEQQKISLKVEDSNLPYIYAIMKNIYKSKISDFGFEFLNLKSVQYDIFSIYLLPSTMIDDIIEKQIEDMKQLVAKSILTTNVSIDYEFDLPNEIKDFITYFNNAKFKYCFESFKVCYTRLDNKDKFYLLTNTKEEILNFDELKKNNYGKPALVSFDNKPYVSATNSAYVNTKTIGFVIFLTILVIIAVTILTLR